MLLNPLKWLLLTLFMFTQFFLISQNISDGLYFNENNEIFFLKNDTVAFRFNNNDAFDSYNFGAFIFICQKNKYLLSPIDISAFFAKTNESELLTDSTFIQVFRGNGEPIVNAPVFIDTIFDNKFYSWIKTSSDKNGIIYLPDNVFSKRKEVFVKIEIHTLGFATKQKFIIQKGKKYLITENPQINYDFTYNIPPLRKWIKLKQVNHKEIKLFDPIKKEWKPFTKSGKYYSLQKSLFLNVKSL